jgi:hypothetical protein
MTPGLEFNLLFPLPLGRMISTRARVLERPGARIGLAFSSHLVAGSGNSFRIDSGDSCRFETGGEALSKAKTPAGPLPHAELEGKRPSSQGASALPETRGLHARQNGPVRVLVVEDEVRVRRLRLRVGGSERSLMLKKLDPVVAHRNRMLAERWLPEVGLGQLGPGLLAQATEADGRRVWHVYRDWGDSGLDRAHGDSGRVRAAVEAVAALHLRFADHALLGEYRLWGGDLGMGFYGASARDGLRALEALVPPAVDLSARGRSGRERLTAELQSLLDQEGERAQEWEEQGGPETLVHGDLWTKNVCVSGDLRVRLIDWDHVAVSRFPYDLSTFLVRFPKERRPGVLSLYAKAVARNGWVLPGPEALNRLFDSAERARIASRVAWPAFSLLRGEAGLRDWAEAALPELAQWFERLEPVLPVEASAVARAS